MSKIEFGKVQLKIMKVLWQKKRSTAMEITTTLNETMNIAHSSVQTHLRDLEKKGAVGHEKSARSFVFFPLVEAENVTQHAVKEFVHSVFSGSAEDMVSFIIKNNYLSRSELKKIQLLLEKSRRDNAESTAP